MGSNLAGETKLVPVVLRRDNAAMNDTHDSEHDGAAPAGSLPDPVEAMAELDPADAPAAAEDLARELASELEEAGGQAAQPVQLRAELGDQQLAEGDAV